MSVLLNIITMPLVWCAGLLAWAWWYDRTGQRMDDALVRSCYAACEPMTPRLGHQMAQQGVVSYWAEKLMAAKDEGAERAAQQARQQLREFLANHPARSCS